MGSHFDDAGSSLSSKGWKSVRWLSELSTTPFEVDPGISERIEKADPTIDGAQETLLTLPIDITSTPVYDRLNPVPALARTYGPDGQSRVCKKPPFK